MVALVSFTNTLLGYLPNVGGASITLQRIIGIFLYPIVWFLEIPASDFLAFSQVVGSKIVLNEVISMVELAKNQLSDPTNVKAIYMISNFGNISTCGITVAGLTVLSPKSQYIKSLINKAFIAGLLSTIMTTCLVSIFM